MDMKCLKCREPWDWWYIRDEVLIDEDHYQEMKTKGGYYKDGYDDSAYIVEQTPRVYLLETRRPTKREVETEAAWQFNPGPVIAQCPACIGKEVKLSEKEEFSSMVQSALADVLGDDIDGLMAEMEDMEF